MNIKVHAVLLSCAIGALTTGSAQADLIKTVPFSLNGSPIQGTVLVPQFDPALGVLNSVTLDVTGTIQFALEDFNTGPGAISVTAHETLLFQGIPLPAAGIFTSTIPSNQTVFTFMPDPVSFGNLTENFGPGAVSFFIGNGTVPFSLSLAAATVDAFTGPTTTNVLAFSGTAGTVTATYAFTPAAAPTPEPATFAMVGLALVGASSLRRRK
jgi:hypothetical protein